MIHLHNNWTPTPKALPKSSQGCKPRSALGNPARTKHTAAVVSTTSIPLVPVMSNRRYDDIERLINFSIHELVFALQHVEADETEPALDALHQVRMNTDVIYDKIARARTRAIKTPEAP